MEPTPKRRGRNSSRSSTSDLEAKEELARYAGLINTIKHDLTFVSNDKEDNKEIRLSDLQSLKVLILCNTGDVQKEVLSILSDIKEKWIKKEIYCYLQEYILQMISDCDIFEFVPFYSLWKSYDYNQFLEIAQPVLRQVAGKNIAEFVFDWIVPSILGTQGHDMEFRMAGTEIASLLAKYVDFEKLDQSVLNSFLLNLPPSIDQLNREDLELLKKYVGFLLELVEVQIFDPKLEKTLKTILNKNPLMPIFVNYVKNFLLIRTIESTNNLKNFSNLYLCWKNYDLPKFSEILKDIVKKKANILICKTFYLDMLIPAVMQHPCSEVTTETRDVLIEICFEFAAFLPINWWLAEEYDKFLKNVNGENSYIKNISALATNKYENWHKLWIFLVRIFSKKLHKNMALINSFLTIVEKAFRNVNISERLKGYDCWKELIDNVALDKNYISSSKQIKLLVTPLRAKFSRQESVIIKRFDIFVYLLEKLQSNGVLILKEFLEFCFGEVGENTDPSKAGGGKTVPQLWIKSAKVLMATIGHCHREKDHCLSTDDVIKLQNRILTQSNIASHYYHLVNSVSECSKLLKGPELEGHRHTILECLWRSTLNTVLSSQSEKRPQFLSVFGKVLEDLLKQEDPYNNSITSIIFKVAMGMDSGKISDFVMSNLSHILKIIFTVSLQEQSSNIEVEKLCLLLFNTQEPEKRNQIKNDILKAFTTFKTCETNVNYVAEIWVNLASEIEGCGKDKSLDYLLWPALHLNHLEPSSKIKEDLTQSYRVLVSCHVEKQKDLHLGLFSSYEKLLKNNPLLASNIMILVEMFSYNLENLEILNYTLKIFSQILILPNTEAIDSHSIKNIDGFLKKCLNSPEFAKIQDLGIVTIFSKCIEYLFKSRHYSCVESLEQFIRNLTENSKFLYSKHLSVDFFMDVFDKEKDMNVTGKIYKIVDSLRNIKDPSIKKPKSSFPMGGRSAKIANLVKNSPESSTPEGSISGLRLFGKTVDSLTPINVRGSILKNSPKTPVTSANKKNKITPSKCSSPALKKNTLPSILDESTSDFVPINSKVKIKSDMLTEHQKETMKKRREDIPALYEDLSQSQSQSITYFGDLSKSKNKEEFRSPEETKKHKTVKELLNDLQISSNNIEIVVETQPVNKTQKPSSFSENLFTESEDFINNINLEDSKTKKELSENILQDGLDETGKKQARMQAELKKLQMNIVGADEFFSPGRAKRIRKSLLPEKSEEENKKITEKKVEEPDAKSKKVEEVNEKVEKRSRRKKNPDTELRDVKTQNTEKIEPILVAEMQSNILPEPGTETKKIDTLASNIQKPAIETQEEKDKFDQNAKESPLENHEKSTRNKRKKSKHENPAEIPVPFLQAASAEKSGIASTGDQEVPAKRRKSLKVEKEDVTIKKSDKKSKTKIDKIQEKTVNENVVKVVSELTVDSQKIQENLPSSETCESVAEDKVLSEKAILDLTLETPALAVKRSRGSRRKEISPHQDSKEENLNIGSPKEFLAKISKKSKDGESAKPIHKEENDIAKEVDLLESPKETTAIRIGRITRSTDSPTQRESPIKADGSKKSSRKSRGASESPVPSTVEKRSSRRLPESPLIQDTPKVAKEIKQDTPKVAKAIKFEEKTEENKQSKVPKELKNLKINIKGAEDYYSPLNNVSKRSRMIQNMAVNKDTGKQIKKCDILPDKKVPKETDESLTKGIEMTKEEEIQIDKDIVVATIKSSDDIGEDVSKSLSEENIRLNTNKNKRKRPISESDSEDLIESSQESVTPLNVLKSRNLSRLSGIINGSKDTSILNQSDVSKSKRISVLEDPEEKSSFGNLMNSVSTVDNSTGKEDGPIDSQSNKNESEKQERPKSPTEIDSCLENSQILADNMDNTSNKVLSIRKVLEVHIELMNTTGTQNTSIQNMQDQEKDDSAKIKNIDVDILKQMREIHGDQSLNTQTQTQDTQTQDTQTQETQTQDTQTQDTQTQDTESYDPKRVQEQQNSEETPTGLQLDLPEKPDLTDSEKLLARMDTETLTETDMNDMFDSSKETVEGDKTTRPEDICSHSEIVKNDSVDSFKNTNEENNDTSMDTNEKNNDANVEYSETLDSSVNICGLDNAAPEVVISMNQAQIDSPIRKGSPNCSSDLPSSPVTGDTPNRTTELLNSTSDISPIGSKSSSSFEEDAVGGKRLVPVALKFDDDDEDHQPTEKSPEKADDAPQKPNSDVSPEKSDTLNQNKTEEQDQGLQKTEEHSTIEDSMPILSENLEIENRIEVIKGGKSISDRSTKLFELVKEGSVSQRFINKRKSSGPTMSPSASRIKKLMSNMKCATPTTTAENVNKEDILTFSREVPSPLAVPGSSILKRKHPEFDEGGYSPATKRKRVNFSDPCTTSRKIFIKDDNHAANLLDAENISLHRELFGDTPNESCTETEGLESEQSCQITNATLLRKDQAIYPQLIKCQDDVIVIVKKVTSPMFVNNLLLKLKNKGITTIGDMASLSEAEVNRYPFKTPVVSNVYKALDDYYKKQSKLSMDSGISVLRSIGDSSDESPLVQKARKSGLVLPIQNVEISGPSGEVLRKCSPRKKLMLLKRGKEEVGIEEKDKQNLEDEMTIDQLGEIVISALETKKILERVKGRVNVQIQDIIDHKNYPDALKEIIETLGISQVFDIVTAVINGVPDQEEAYGHRMLENSTKHPLDKFLQSRTLDEVQKSLWKCVEDNIFTKQEILTTVFVPHLSITDLNSIFDMLTDVDIENVVLSRLKSESSDSFVLRIIEKHPVNTLQVVSKLNLEELTPEDNVSVVSRLLKVDTLQNNHLIEIFEMVSKTLASRLPSNVLMSLAVELLRKIPLKE